MGNRLARKRRRQPPPQQAAAEQDANNAEQESDDEPMQHLSGIRRIKIQHKDDDAEPEPNIVVEHRLVHIKDIIYRDVLDDVCIMGRWWCFTCDSVFLAQRDALEVHKARCACTRVIWYCGVKFDPNCGGEYPRAFIENEPERPKAPEHVSHRDEEEERGNKTATADTRSVADAVGQIDVSTAAPSCDDTRGNKTATADTRSATDAIGLLDASTAASPCGDACGNEQRQAP